MKETKKERIFADFSKTFSGDHLVDYQTQKMMTHGFDVKDIDLYCSGFQDGFAKAMLLISNGELEIQIIERMKDETQ